MSTTLEQTALAPSPSLAEQAPAVEPQPFQQRPEPKEPTREERFKAGLETFQKLSGAKAGQERGADGKFAPKTEPLTPEAPAGKQETPKQDEGDRELALTSLRRAKVSEDALKGLSEDGRLTLGRAFAKILGDGDRMGRELAQLKKTPETPKAADSGKPPEEPATRTNLRDLATKVAADLGLEDASAIEQMLGAATAPLVEENARLKKLAESTEGAAASALKHSARSQLRGVFPELDDKEAFAKVEARMKRLAAPEGAYDDIADPMDAMIECMKDACGLEFREQMEARAKALNAKRDAGQPGASQRSGGKYSQMTEKEWALASYQLLKTKTPAEVRALRGQ